MTDVKETAPRNGRPPLAEEKTPQTPPDAKGRERRKPSEVLVAAAKKAARPFAYLAVPVAVFVMLMHFALLPANLADILILIISVVLFILSLPVSIILHLETSAASAAVGARENALLIGLAYVYLNFFLLSLLLCILPGHESKKTKPGKRKGVSLRKVK